MIYMGTRDAIETPSAALEALPEPYNFASQTMLQVNCYNFKNNFSWKISHDPNSKSSCLDSRDFYEKYIMKSYIIRIQ